MPQTYYQPQFSFILMDYFKVIPSDEETAMIVPEPALNCMKTLKSMFETQKGNIHIPVKKATFQKVLQFLKMHNYQDVKIGLVQSNDLKTVFQGNQRSYQFISNYKNAPGKSYSLELGVLFQAASYLKCEPLINVISAYIASIIYFDDSLEGSSKVRQRLGFYKEFSIQDQERFSKYYT